MSQYLAKVMRILLVNNFHYLRGGSERAYFDMAEILRENGHEVAFFSTVGERNYPSVWSKYFVSYLDLSGKQNLKNKLRITGRIFYNREAARRIRGIIEDFKPDIAHLHNIYHHLSPSVIKELKKHDIPTAMTLHDYKLVSPNYNLFSRGEVWEKSKRKRYYLCLWEKCIKDSYLKSLVCTLEAYFHNLWGIYEQADAFISPSSFLIDKFREFGFNRKIYHVPNPVLIPEVDTTAESERKSEDPDKRYLLYFGRLSREKGVEDLIKAYDVYTRQGEGRNMGLKITGHGPQRKELEDLTEKRGLKERVEFTGPREKEELVDIVRNAEAVVFPSNWYENYPYAVAEAQQLGRTVICSDMGGAGEMVEDGHSGLLYTAGDVEELASLIQNIASGRIPLTEIGENARRIAAERNSKKVFYNKLMGIYSRIITNTTKEYV